MAKFDFCLFFLQEMLKKKTEYEILLHNKDELIQQRVQGELSPLIVSYYGILE